ncbi:hypothetical protein [Lysobacter enzymogenes]|uniref:hypothetical protein n=1 Tax=Lysobacter enzymogenes TaxID=69 RepID=UPI0008954ED6|nr:hypothetical protein [Lysobacter enzymogenes]SDX52764.1 hypothetical protein SAMN05421681_10626 [Lysobacter enzymogenes]
MSDNTSTAQSGGGEALAAQPQQPTQQPAAPARAPRNDAEAAQQAAAATEAQQQATEAEAAKSEAAAKEHKNRTRSYIERLQQENAEYRRQLAGGGQQQPTQRPAQGSQQQPAKAPPTLEECDFDHERWLKEQVQHGVREALASSQSEQQQRQANESAVKTESAYQARANEFAEQHPDYDEVVYSIPYELSEQLQLAIKTHEKGPEIAYFLGKNDDEAWSIASLPPHLAAAAVDRLAKRLTGANAAAPQQPQNAAAAAAPAQPSAPQTPPVAAAAPAKQLTNAPPPAPTLGGRSPTDTPSEKLTDDQWAKRELERRRKR